jgi:hypothetical protein
MLLTRTDMGDFENSGKPDPASAHVTPKTAIGGALSGRELRDVLLFLDAVYRGIGPLNLAGDYHSGCASPFEVPGDMRCPVCQPSDG